VRAGGYADHDLSSRPHEERVNGLGLTARAFALLLP
jgi:hypothetical protein